MCDWWYVKILLLTGQCWNLAGNSGFFVSFKFPLLSCRVSEISLESYSVQTWQKSFGWDYEPRFPVCIHRWRYHICSLKIGVNVSLMDYGNTKVTQHSLKTFEHSECAENKIAQCKTDQSVDVWCVKWHSAMHSEIMSILLHSGPLSPSITTPLPPLELSSQEQQELGYMPLRDDFERVGAADPYWNE